MKRVIAILLLAFMLPLGGSAQKIKIKKGNILLNKKEKIGTSSYLGEEGYSVKDLNYNEIRVKQVRGDSGSQTDYYYTWEANFNDSKIEMTSADIGYSSSKGTVKYLLNNGYWNAKTGFNIEAINLKMVNTGNAVTDALSAEKENEVRAKGIDPFVKRNGEIVMGGHEGTVVIGYVESPDHYLETSITRIKIYDLDKNLIAKGKSTIISDEVFTTFDGVKHKYKITKELNEIFKPLFLSEVVYLLVLEGYIYEGKMPFNEEVSIFKKD
ncbi:MAG: hypothetical protein V3U92_18860 [Cellulophaga sp.]